MTITTPAAARAADFMRQCRIQQQASTTILQRLSTRSVSSSHLAPSNFSKQTRRRDTEIEYPRFSNLPRRNPNLSKKRPIPTNPAASITIPPGFLNFVKYRILSFTPPPPAPHKPPPFNVLNNPWRTKKTWPPDFESMHPKQQFHFEKTFRRRLVMKTNSQRYNWNRYVKLLQQSLIVLTVIYFIFIADPYAKDGGGTPVDGFRAWFFGQVGKFEHLPEGLKEQAAELQAYYSKNWKKAPWQEGDEASPVATEAVVEKERA